MQVRTREFQNRTLFFYQECDQMGNLHPWRYSEFTGQVPEEPGLTGPGSRSQTSSHHKSDAV